MGEEDKVPGYHQLPAWWVGQTNNHLLTTEWGWGRDRGTAVGYGSSEEGSPFRTRPGGQRRLPGGSAVSAESRKGNKRGKSCEEPPWS